MYHISFATVNASQGKQWWWSKTYVCTIKDGLMAPHSSTLAWKTPWTEEPGGLQSMGSRRVRHDWATSLSLFTFMHWRRKWQPTPVFLPGESQGQGCLVGCRLWGSNCLFSPKPLKIEGLKPSVTFEPEGSYGRN